MATAYLLCSARLAGRPHDDLVHAHVRRTRDRVQDLRGDVLRLQDLADLLAIALHRAADERVRVVPLKLRLDEAGRHGGHADPDVQRLLAERLGEGVYAELG